MKRKLSKHSPSELVRQSKKQASGSIPLGILGTSQDGVDNKIVLEVKCQYTERNVSIEEAVKSAAWREWARL